MIMWVILQEEETGETPNRCDMFTVTHTKKDGNPVNKLAREALVSAKYVLLREYGYGKYIFVQILCSQGSIYWSPNDGCWQVLGWEQSGRVRGVGLGPTPGKSTSYTSGQWSISSAPTLKEQAMTIEMERLKNLYKSQNVLYQAQHEELVAVKRMVEMIMKGKQPLMGNN
jgi:hypothetical protein